MRIGVEIRDWDARTATQLVAVLADHNARQISGRRLPHLYDSGARYRVDPADEPLYDAATVLQRGAGDCEDLAAYLAADLRLYGMAALPPAHPLHHHIGLEPSTARPVLLDFGGLQYHAVVRIDSARGVVEEDPSGRLGMSGPIEPWLVSLWKRISP